MKALIDIHCHILPGIDDGPAHIAGSIEMAKAAVASGISVVAATPHLRRDFPMVRVDELAQRCEALQSRLSDEGIPLSVVPGGEVALSWALEADDEALRLASYGQRGTDILIETPTSGGAILPTLLSQVAVRGYRITLAHPERMAEFADDLDPLEQMVARQVLFAVNADSVLGNRRKSSSATIAHRLLNRRMVSVIASDGHRGYEHRPIGRLSDAASAVAASFDSTVAGCLTDSIPAAILSGTQLPVIPWPNDSPRRRGLWRRRR